MKTVIYNLYVLQTANRLKAHGGKEYGMTVLDCLIREYGEKAKYLVIYNASLFMDEWLIDLIQENGIELIDVKSEGEFVETCKKVDADIIYSPISLDIRLKERIGDSLIFKETIHDMRGFTQVSDLFALRWFPLIPAVKMIGKRILWPILKRKRLEQAKRNLYAIDKIICISNYSKYSVLSFFPELMRKEIKVFYTPPKMCLGGANQDAEDSLGKYILVLGGNRWIKNPYRTLCALDDLFSEQYYYDYKAVVIGMPYKKIVKSLRNKEKFLFYDYVDARRLENLYGSCELFVYASLEEGFGMPPLEAMRYGKTCILSGGSSLPEIYGEAAYYVNPASIEEIKGKIMLALEEKVSPEIVKKQYEKITRRQRDDLKKLCEYIIG